MKELQHSLISRSGASNPNTLKHEYPAIEGVRATLSLVWVRCEGQVQEVGLRAQSDSLQVLHLNYFGDNCPFVGVFVGLSLLYMVYLCLCLG